MKRTLLFIIAALVVIFGFDLFTLFHDGYESTISWVTYTLAQKQPIVPFLLGIVFGHLFWPNRAGNGVLK